VTLGSQRVKSKTWTIAEGTRRKPKMESEWLTELVLMGES